MTEPIDVTSSVSSAVAIREEQPQQQPGAIQRFDARDRQTAIEAVLNRAAVVREVMDKVMKQDVHYGTIPGTNDKKVLLKAGAEKLSAVFRLTPTFSIYQTDYQNFHREYRVTCRLSDGTEGVGTCTTLEEKYRYRKGARKCPQCGKETIIEGKAEFGGGWLCWAKKGGCGAKFDKADTTITSQRVDKVEHTNPADYWNTTLKMSKKRAHVDAIITATATSDLLTQDLEEITDLADEASGATAEKEREPAPAKKKEQRESKEPKKPVKTTTPDELPAAELKRTAEWLEAGKKTFVQKMTDDPIALPFAWLWAVQSGYILPTERLDDVPAERLFKSCNPNVTVEANKPFMRADYDEAMKAIMEVGQKGPLSFKDKSEFEAAYKEKPTKAPAKAKADKPDKPIEVPRDPEAAWKALPIPAWSSHVKEKGFKTFGALPKNLLWWWCCSWQPKGYNGQPPAEADVKLRAILDTVKGQYDFENREDAGSEPGSAAKPEEPDDVPF